MGVHTAYYTKLFSERGPKQSFYNPTEANFYFAVRGDVTALHSFLNLRDRDNDGAQGEGWDADMVILALVYGDSGLYSALQTEPPAVRESAGMTIEQLMKEKNREAFV